MKRDRLYEAAFRYKKAGLWKKIWDNEIFAIKLKSGEIGYISIMGKNGEYCALGLYIGEKGFQSYRIMANMNFYTGFDTPGFKEHEMLLKQDCLQMALECKDMLMPDEVEEVRDYAEKNKIRLAGKNAYPQFIKYEPGCHPWKVKTKEDMNALVEAMELSILVAEALKSNTPKELGIHEVKAHTKEVPLFGINKGMLEKTGSVAIPGDPVESYEYVKAENQIAVASVKKLPKKDIWEAELIMMLEPVQDNPEETPYYPMMLLMVESKTGYILPTPMVEHPMEDPHAILQSYANTCREHGLYPKEIRCRDERTYALLKDFCDKTGVKTEVYSGRMSALQEAEDSLLEHFGGGNDEPNILDDMLQTITDILNLSDEELRSMPSPLLSEFKSLISMGVLPEDINHLLEEKLKRL